MIQSLQAQVVPELRRRGFIGSFPHFRRSADAALHLLTFQFDKYGGGFVVELAVCPRAGVLLDTGEHITPEKVNAHSVNRRLRLGAAAEGQDHWFRYDGLLRRFTASRYDKAAQRVLFLLDEQGEPWWRSAAASIS